MLRIKKLQIQGFKSFCDRTELQFPGTGVVAVVGPNGCGKSNLADAISWVLGEQSAKSLRGGRMEDVIFSGTRDRPPTGMAEVTLTLIDPEQYDLAEAEPEEEAAPEAGDGWQEDEAVAEAAEPDGVAEAGAAAAEGASKPGAVVLTIRRRRRSASPHRRGEVSVTRRLFRNGESEYLMNGKACRLRDIQELFLGTGLGPESYAIIEQGRIGQILSSKPYDRRAIIEEAAGVSKYKARRRLAGARLEASRQNLSRINDIFEEVTRQVASLKRQAAKAERYRALKTEFDQQQRRLVLARAQALEAAQAAQSAREAEAREAFGGAHQDVAAREAAEAAARREEARLEQELREATATAGRLKREVEQSRQQIAFQRQQSAELEQRARELGREQQRLAQQGAELAAEQDAAERAQQAAAGLAATAGAAFEQRRRRHQEAQGAARAQEQALDAERRETLAAMGRAAGLGNRLAQDEALLRGLESQLQRLEEELARSGREMEAGGERRGQLALAFQDQESESAAVAIRVRELEERAAALRRESEQARELAQQSRTDLAGAAARRRSLEEIVAHHGYSSEAVRRLFTPGGRPAGFEPLGVLGEFLEAEAPYDRVLEQFLHDELNYIVVRDWDQAGAGMQLLRTQEQGRATFLIHEAAEGGAEPEAALAAEPGVASLLGEVKALNGFRQSLGAMLPKLRDAFLVADAAEAQRLAARHPKAYFLTPGGESYHNRTVSGGAGTSSGPLSLKRELRDLARRQQTEEATLARREQQRQSLTVELERVTAEMAQAAARRHELEKQLLTSGQAVRQLDAEVQRAQARWQQAQLEAERARAERVQAGDRLQAGREELAALTASIAASQERERAAAEAAAGARQQSEAEAQAMSEAQAEAARSEERARAATAVTEQLRRQREQNALRLGQTAAEAGTLDGRAGAVLAEATALELALAGMETAWSGAEAAQAAQESALAAARSRARQDEAALAERRLQLEARRQELSECEIALARLEADAEHLRQNCRDELGCELAELAGGAGDAPGAALPELETATRELRQRLEQMGPVNMMALEEYEETRERHAFMEAQRRDLLDSMADTQKAIQEMDGISRQKFQEAFERINEYFQETFRILFGGGQGFLRLSEPAAPAGGEDAASADCGVDIVAQPPGKRLQNALLLSGGEKAMTAMALLLAVFRYQPSPFCLLDEVDAPMDEANVIRFSDMVRRMSAQTQFILITHNKRTMEAAPTLYGVTMPQAGVSRLVSVLMEEARQDAAS